MVHELKLKIVWHRTRWLIVHGIRVLPCWTSPLVTAAIQVNASITIWNNGRGIPVEIHKEEQVYVPELIFGHLLTSSNYDDDEKKVGLSSFSLSQLHHARQDWKEIGT